MLSRTLPLYRFKQSDAGATAVEFALVGPIFLLLMFAIFEVSLMFFAAVNLDGAAILPMAITPPVIPSIPRMAIGQKVCWAARYQEVPQANWIAAGWTCARA